MSLGQWFRDYVYIPMGGNRVGTLKHLRNIFTVWFLTGFWHGADWNFIVWGLYFAVLLTLEKLVLGKYLAKHGYQERFDIINGHLHKVCENTRKAYLSGDKKKLLEIAEKDYTTAMERIKNFHKVYQKWWMSENKPHGFDMQDIRIGGALQRLESCKERIISYCKGELDSIPELEEQRLEGNTHTTWARTVTPNVISHVV